MKLKIPKGFDLGKKRWDIEYFARLIVLASIIVLAMWTILSSPFGQFWFARIFLIIFIIALSIVFYFEVQSLLRRRQNSQQKDKGIPKHREQSGRNRWILIGLLVLAAVILVAIFVPRQLQLDPQGYQTFFIAFAGIGAWVTGIALAVFAYQQYKLRQTEHRLLFEPQILLRSAGTPITGELTYNNQRYPYRIEWTVLILNTSQQPILIEFMSLRIRQWGWGKATDKEGYLNIPSYHVLEPDGLEPPFQVTLTTPQRIRWIIEGYNAGQDLDDFFGDSNNRNFELIFYVQATNPQDPGTSIFYGIISNSFRVPKDAKWGNSIGVLQ